MNGIIEFLAGTLLIVVMCGGILGVILGMYMCLSILLKEINKNGKR